MDNSGLRLRSITFKDTSAMGAMRLSDGMQNVLTGVGGRLDPLSNAFYYTKQYAPQQLEASLRGSWISDKIHRKPPRDMVRAWRSWKAENADITLIEREERRLGIRSKVEEALLWARLYGGSCIFFGINNDDPATPLDVNTIKKGSVKYAHTLTRWQVNVPDLILDPGSPYYMQPSQYQINTGDGQTFPVHPSRIVRFLGKKLPENVAVSQQAWGDPLLATIESAVLQSDTVQASFAAIASRAREDTVGIPDLMNIVSTAEGERMMQQRIMTVAAFRSMFHINFLANGRSKDDASETWQQWQADFSGMPDVMMAFLQVAAAASDMPMTAFAGMSPGGLNSTGDGDERGYNVTISSGQELDLRPHLELMDEMLIRSALGNRPESIFFVFNPLRIDTDTEKAENSKTRAEADSTLSDSGLVPPEVMQAAVKSRLIESGEYPGIEQAYADYESGILEPIVETPEEAPVDPLIPVDPTTGQPTQNRESRLFAANDAMVAALLRQGHAVQDAVRLADAEQRPVYVSRRLLNASDVRTHFEKHGLKVTVADAKQHVTVIYSKTAVDWMKAGCGSWGTAELTVPAGGPRMMDRFGPNENAVVLMFASDQLSWRHKELLEAGCSHDFDYHAHVTLNYDGQDVDLDSIVPYKGELRFGFEDWQEIQTDWSGNDD